MRRRASSLNFPAANWAAMLARSAATSASWTAASSADGSPAIVVSDV